MPEVVLNEATVTARMRIEWLRFRECGEVLLGKKLFSKIKA